MHIKLPKSAETILDILHFRASHQADREAYTFLGAEAGSASTLTYQELYEKARAVADAVHAKGLNGERVLLMFPPGLDYIAAFLGCLIGGAVAVPIYPPRQNHSSHRLKTIFTESGAKGAITTNVSDTQKLLGTDNSDISEKTRWISLGENDETALGTINLTNFPDIDLIHNRKDQIAFLQYTSGSTSNPKGVMVSHGNIIRNLTLIDETFRLSTNDRGVIWLPPYHDMGLIGGILYPLFQGFPVTLMQPASFLQRPFRWLDSISKSGATASGAPNFAYDLCVRAIPPEQRDQLDLSRWTLAFCGSEPIHPETLDRFAAYFEPAGFKREAFRPCYGLAEATLFVSGRRGTDPLTVKPFDAKALAMHRVSDKAANGDRRSLISSGAVSVEQLRIVDPETRRPCPPDRIGEIWVADPCNAQGYWNKPEATAETFAAHTADGREGPFMRTGDLGFLLDGELFVTGRLKELIILRGRNLYPQDIEAVVATAHPFLQPGHSAAFSVEREGEERLVVVQEVKRQHRKTVDEQVAQAIRAAVAQAHEVEVDAVILVPPLTIPKTSSGKTQRRLCRSRYLDGQMKTLLESVRGGARAGSVNGAPGPALAPSSSVIVPPPASPASPTPGTEDIRSWLVDKVAQTLEVAPSEISIRAPFQSFGLGSIQALSLSGELETLLGRDLSPTILWDHPTIDQLATYLTGVNGTKPSVGPEKTEAEKTGHEADLSAPAPSPTPLHPLLGERISSPLASLQYSAPIGPRHWGPLVDHQVFGSTVFPAAGYLEIAAAAARTVLGMPVQTIENVDISRFMIFTDSAPRRIQTIIQPDRTPATFDIYAEEMEDGLATWTRQAGGRFSTTPSRLAWGGPALINYLKGECPDAEDVARYYDELRHNGVAYGSQFQAVAALWRGPGQALGRLRVAPTTSGGRPEEPPPSRPDYVLHPAMLDAAFQIAGAALNRDGEERIYFPVSVKRLTCAAPLPTECWAHLKVEESGPTLSCRIRVFDQNGVPLADIEDLKLRRMRRRTWFRLNRMRDPEIDPGRSPETPPWPASSDATPETPPSDHLDDLTEDQLVALLSRRLSSIRGGDRSHDTSSP